VKGLYHVRVREAVGRGKEDGMSGGWVASCFWGGGKGMMFCGLGSGRKRRELGE